VTVGISISRRPDHRTTTVSPACAGDDSGLLLKAVLAGQGAGLLPATMVALDIAKGRPAQLAEVALLEALAYYLVYPEASRQRPKVAAFRAWILAAAAGNIVPANAPVRSAHRHDQSFADRDQQAAAPSIIR